jgi:CO/xanthine dehydrogenase FAD-binding subunit
MALNEFLQPTTIAQAVATLSSGGGRVPLAGGTFLALHVPPKTRGLVDLSRLGLRYVRECKSGLAVGAMTTFADLAGDARTGALGRILAGTATEPLRQMITVGGNVMIPLRWSDLPLLLTALNARVALRQRGTRTVAIENLLAQSPRAVLRPGEIVKEVRLPSMRTMRLVRRKLVRMHDDVPALHVAVGMRMGRTRMRDVRIAYVAQKPLPVRLAQAERALEGARPDAGNLMRAAAAAVEECGALSDQRYSSEYLREMLGVFVRTCAAQCTGVGGGNDSED